MKNFESFVLITLIAFLPFLHRSLDIVDKNGTGKHQEKTPPGLEKHKGKKDLPEAADHANEHASHRLLEDKKDAKPAAASDQEVELWRQQRNQNPDKPPKADEKQIQKWKQHHQEKLNAQAKRLLEENSSVESRRKGNGVAPPPAPPAIHRPRGLQPSPATAAPALGLSMPAASSFPWSSWGFNTGWTNNDMTLGNGQTLTDGSGSSSIDLNEQGMSAGAEGEKGSATKGSWKNANNSNSNNNAFGNPPATGGATAAGSPFGGAFSTGWSNVSQTMGDVESMAMGSGASSLAIGKKGTSAKASGTLGTKNTASWGNNVNAWSNNYAYAS